MIPYAFSNPIPGTITLASAGFTTAPPGYAIEERFVSGIAASFILEGSAPADVSAVPANTAEYRTRIVLLRPTDAARFNGTVLLEWLNVTGGTDAAPDWTYLHREIERGGYAYIAVSAQFAGIEGGPISMPGMPPIKQGDPERYGSLRHPGDAFSFDIFTQVGALLRGADANGILGELRPARLIAIGESQSAAFLVTYVNLVDPLATVFDGFLIHSRFRGAAPLDGNYMASFQAMAAGQVIEPVPFITDLRVPVLNFITETDLLSPGVGFIAARQADSAMLRTWEVAGTAHADTYTLAGGEIDTGSASIETLATAFEPVASLFGQPLPLPINAAPQHHYIVQAGLRSLVAWVGSAVPPPSAPQIETTFGSEPIIMRDGMGNACGGIRSPWMDAPSAVFSGFGQALGGFASLFGSTVAFEAQDLEALYPNGLGDYIEKFTDALDQAIANGHILADDRTEILALATHSYPEE